jgi:hypothetical protein
MRRKQLPPHKTATYVMPRFKAVYVSVPKAACTSLKWLVADLQGEKAERFERSLSREVTRAMTIHRRSMWQHTPMLHELSDEQLAEIAPENGWFIFTVVRHPSARLFSAWQSKFLLREPRWEHDLGEVPWFPRVPRRTEDVVEDFGRFVRSIDEDPGQQVMRDRHFRPQVELITADRTPYSRVYGTKEIPQLLRDFDAHLRAQGWEGELRLRRSNETPLAPIAALFTPDVKAALQHRYAGDFEAFGYSDVVPDGLDPDGAWPERSFAEIERLVERSERIGDLAMRGQALRAQLGELKQRRPPKPAQQTAVSAPPALSLRRAVRRVQRKLG